MSLYRQPGQARRRRRLLAAGLVAAVAAIVLVIVLVAGDSGPPTAAERATAARGAVSEALDGLELLEIEYGQAVRDGRVTAPTEYDAARADVRRARQAIDEHRDDFAAAGAPALARAQQSLDRVADAVQAKTSSAALKSAIATAQADLKALAP